MPKLEWDKTSERLYETGVDHAVLYPRSTTGTYPNGVPWNGITSVTESPSGAESNKKYADNRVYLNMISAEEFGATIEAYMYPLEFSECDGSKEVMAGVKIGQQTRQPFGLVYRTILGNDTENNDHGYLLHIIYNSLAAPSEKAYETINESPDGITFSWELTSTPENVTTIEKAKPVSTIVIDSTKLDATKLAALEKVLFGGTEIAEVATLPLPDEIFALLDATNP